MHKQVHYLGVFAPISLSGNRIGWLVWLSPFASLLDKHLNTVLESSSLAEYGRVSGFVMDATQTLIAGARNVNEEESLNRWVSWRGIDMSVTVVTDRVNSDMRIAEDRLMIVFAFVVLLVLQMSSLAWLIKHYLLDRVNDLNNVARAFAAGDYMARVESSDGDELGQLGQVFNAMCAEISQAQLYLKKMIEVRTRQARESSERLQAILSSVGDAIISINAKGEIISFNKAAELIFGYSEQEMTGQSVNLLMPVNHAVAHDKYIQLANERGSTDGEQFGFERQLQAKRRNGERFPVAITLNKGISSGEVFYTGVIEDLSEKKAAERKLAEKERLLNTAIHTSSQTFVIVSVDGDFIEVNEAACQWFGYSREELLNMNVADVTAEKYRISTISSVEKMREGQLKTLTREKQYVRKDGTVVWGLLSSTAVNDEHGQPMLFVSQITDIDEPKRLAEELASRNRELERSNSDLDQFAYVASHDLKSPLNAIKKIISWIEEDCGGQLGSAAHDNIELLKNRADRMMQLLNDLLVYSRVGRTKEDVEAVELKSLCTGIFEILDRPSGFSLTVSAAELVVPRIPFELVMRNLLSNAIKHHDRTKGNIWVSLGKEREGYVIRVRDDGPGIPPDMQFKAMEMFQTLKPRDQIEGSGMGLALVRKTIEHFGGSVAIESDGKRGTTVVMRWPFKDISE